MTDHELTNYEDGPLSVCTSVRQIQRKKAEKRKKHGTQL